MYMVRHNQLVSVASPTTGTTATAPARPPRRRRPGYSRDRWWLRLLSPVVAVGLWQLLSATGVLPPSKLVSPASIAHTAYTLVTTNSPTYGTLQASLLVSAERWESASRSARSSPSPSRS